jgi:pSer/pThr/pTyr-binding forkhead associated (FHA) protein
MIDYVKQNTLGKTKDVKIIRDQLLQFIKEKLKTLEGGEGRNIKGLHLYFSATEEEKHLYESAVYFEQPEKFKNQDIQRIADDFMIDLPENWSLEIDFLDELPKEAMKIAGLDAALFIKTKKTNLKKSATAYIKILNGEAEKEVYQINSASGKINIGRESKVQGSDGFFRVNHIAFPGNSGNEVNKFISRQHAHIDFDNDTGHFLIFADEGGIPPRNKVKVRSAEESTPVKLYSTHIGHVLEEGDQIMIGDAAILSFSYSAD